MSSFKNRVLDIVRMIPKGKVASYSQIAAYAGVPRGAREVGWILNGIDTLEEVPWWRVVNMARYLSIRGNQTADKEFQRKLLINDGIDVSENFTLDMKKYQFTLNLERLRELQLDDQYIEKILAKYSL